MLTNPIDVDLSLDVAIIVKNDSDMNSRLQEVCLASVIEDDASTNNVADAYRAAYRDRGHEWGTYLSCARMRVVDEVMDVIDSTVSEGVMRDLLMQRLDIGNVLVWEDITEDFMPMPEDVESELWS